MDIPSYFGFTSFYGNEPEEVALPNNQGIDSLPLSSNYQVVNQDGEIIHSGMVSLETLNALLRPQDN